MAHAVEVRPPFLDHRIVEFAATLPSSFKIRGSRQKFILKELMEDKLPPSVLATQQDRLRYSRARMAARPAAALVARYAHSVGVRALPIFQATAAIESRRSNRHLERRANLGYHLWGLLVLFLWMKRWRIQTAPISRTNRAGGGKRSYLYLVVLLVAERNLSRVHRFSAVADGRCGRRAGPDRAQHAQSGDWVTARLDGVAYLEKAPLIYWTMAGSYKVFGVHDWAARIPIALSAIALCSSHGGFRHLGFREARRLLCGLMHRHVHRTVSFHADLDSRCDADFHHCAGDVGFSARCSTRMNLIRGSGPSILAREPRAGPAAEEPGFRGVSGGRRLWSIWWSRSQLFSAAHVEAPPSILADA